ncbi:AMP-binding protein [Phytoactinopolyspora mesophila]|uniref:AMP-binding protein n=1 Tax=Phytoactinopolyspora mesophila TaxID=2650750 RepID=A0A7K3M7X4_9ACTN|nr:AMP-binding protein [Phytoactinopolyspora mesophila]NDL59364.1 AMP-binding protein [Phytoactinopolyspora mesophila]
MQLSRSAHVDTFCRDRLPPEHTWPQMLFDLPDVRYPDRLNCASELLDTTIEHYGADRTCLRTATETWTYGQLRDHANQIANVLTTQFGLVPGNRVLLRAPNNPWLVATWLGVLKAGGVVVLTMPLLRPAELITTIEMTRPDVAISDHRFLTDLQTARESAAPDLPVVPYGSSAGDDLLTLARGASTDFDDVPTAADDVALLAPTSGTTGKPKVTMHFHRDVLANADTFSRHIVKPTPDDVFTTTAPFAFTFGLGAALVFPLHAGASTLLVEKATPGELADAVAEHGVTVLFTAPTAYKAMIAGGKAGQLRGLRRAVSAGEHLPEASWQAFHDATGVRIIDGIGATEMLHIFIAAADDDIRPGSTGRPVPGYVATVLDESGAEAPPGVAGRLAVRGPTGCRYLADERQSVYVQHGWNVTGDTYLRDADGYFWYQARSDDMIVSSGYNIAGPEVEQALLTHPDVAECAVIGVPDEDRGQLVKAVVVLNEQAPHDDDTVRKLQNHVKSQIAPYKYPRSVEFRDSLPKTQTGKLQRYRLRQEATAAAGRQTPAATTPSA